MTQRAFVYGAQRNHFYQRVLPFCTLSRSIPSFSIPLLIFPVRTHETAVIYPAHHASANTKKNSVRRWK